MDKIKITSSLLEEKAYFKGIESNIYVVDGLLYKVFKGLDDNVIKNKIEKVEILNDLNVEDFDPKGIIYLNNTILGYAMSYDKDLTEIDSFKTPNKLKIDMLKQIKIKLDNLHNKGIVYGDLNPTNILQKNYIASLCDFDNVCVSNHPFDTISIVEKSYLNKFGKEDLERLDTYMLNAVTISLLTNVVISYAIIDLYNNGLPLILKTKENKEIADAMICLDNKDKIEPFVDHVKRYHL